MSYQGNFNKFSVNNVLIADESDGTFGFPPQVFYFVPVYLRLKIKNFTQLNLQSLNTQMKCVIFLTIYYGGLSQQIVEKIIREMNISFQYNKKIDLSQQSQSQQLCLRINEQEKTLNFYIYHQVTMTVVPHVFWTPFEVIESDLTIILNSIITKIGDKRITIKFNIMDHDNQYLKFYYSQDVHFGHYDLAQKRLQVQYTNKNQNYYTFFEQYTNEKINKDKEYQISMKYIELISKQHKKIKKKLKSQNELQIPTSQELNLVSLQSYAEENQKSIPGSKKSHKLQLPTQKYTIKVNNNVVDDVRSVTFKKKISQMSQDLSLQCNLEPQKIDSHQNSEYQSIKDKGLRMMQLSKIQNYKYAKFHIVLYKKPIASIFALYAPLWLLAFINLSIFFQDNGLGNRIQNIAALVIAFVAFIPVVREQLPTIPNITFVELVIIGQAFASLLCLIQSLVVRNQIDFVFVWYQDGFFITSLIITLLGVIIVVGMLLIHQFYFQDAYNATIEDTKFQQFKSKQWYNQQLAQYLCSLSSNCLSNLKPLPIPKTNPHTLLFNNMTFLLLQEQIKARLMGSV